MEKENSKNKGINVTRKVFLQLGLWVSGLASAWGIFQFLNYETPGEVLLQSITLYKPNTVPLGSVTFIQEIKAWLVRDSEGIYAISAICTHLGCTIGEGEEKFVCPCHGSEFDFNSRVLQGPATKSLPNFEVSLSEGGLIVIDRQVIVPPTQRL